GLQPATTIDPTEFRTSAPRDLRTARPRLIRDDPSDHLEILFVELATPDRHHRRQPRRHHYCLHRAARPDRVRSLDHGGDATRPNTVCPARIRNTTNPRSRAQVPSGEPAVVGNAKGFTGWGWLPTGPCRKVSA